MSVNMEDASIQRMQISQMLVGDYDPGSIRDTLGLLVTKTNDVELSEHTSHDFYESIKIGGLPLVYGLNNPTGFCVLESK
jgi:hypothetical protein